MGRILPTPGQQTLNTMKPTIKAISALLVSLKADICDDYRCSDEPDDNTPGMCVTVSTNEACDEWSYQTGDNSYSGSCYHHSFWSVIYLYRRSDSTALAREAVCELLESAREAREYAKHTINATV